MRPGRVLTLVALVASTACQQPRSVEFTLRFENDATRSAASAVRVRILNGGCSGSLRYSDAFDLGDPGSARIPPVLPPGTYGFEVEARDDGCLIVARSCVTRDLPLQEEVLELNVPDVTPTSACEGAACVDGICMNDEPDTGPGEQDTGPPPMPDGGPGADCSGDGECPGGTCRNEMCCNGCWDGSSCQAGTTEAACGSAGAMCSACGGSQSCVAGTCAEPPPVALSLSPVTTYLAAGGFLYSAGATASSMRGTPESSTANVLVRQSTSVAFSDVAASQFATCGLDLDGGLYCWGRNSPGLLGIGSGDFSRVEADPQRVGADTWKDVAAGNQHFCAIRTDDALLCWGSNAEGQLGVDGGSRNAPTEVDAGGTWRAVSPGDTHTCAVRTDGTLFCWGSATDGRLGDPGAAGGVMAVQVGTRTDWTAVSAGVEHSCGIAGGELFCWGTQEFGRLGDGMTTGMADAPVSVDSSNTWTSVHAGQFHTCALTNAREVFCWGVSAFGQTGVGDSATPARVTSGLDLLAVGWTHTCAVALDGEAFESIRCWGQNSDGMLGTGDTDNKTTPTPTMLEPAL